MALQFVGAVERLELEIEVNRLHFLDAHPLRVLVDGETVDAPGDGDAPPAEVQAMDDVDLGAIVGVVIGPLLRAAGVDLLPDPHATEAVPPLHPDAAIGRPLDEI